MTADRPDWTGFAPIAVPLEAAGPPAGRARLVVAGWLLGLTAIAALGVSGHEPAAESTAASVAGLPSPPAAPAPTRRPAVTGQIARQPVHGLRSLGDDGLVGGIVFGDNVPPAD